MKFEEVYTRWQGKRLTQQRAGQLLGVSERTFRRQIGRFEARGMDGLIDLRMSRVSSRRAPVNELLGVVRLYRSDCADWNVKHFHAWYEREHGGTRSYSWVKNVLQEAKLVVPSRAEAVRLRWMEWLYDLERGAFADDPLATALPGCGTSARKRILSVMAHRRGFSKNAVAEHLCIARKTVLRHLTAFNTGGIDALLGGKGRPRKTDDEAFRKALFGLLHEPPSLSGFNRTTWRLSDLRETLSAKGFPACESVIREAIRKAGFRWRSAKVVLTSTDPEYREKLDRVREVLSNLGDDERFSSVDEYGPFAVKAKAGRVLAGPGENPSVQQWQKSKGWLIATAALELSRNRVTHFYSRAKNTAEMIRMAETLLEEYPNTRTLYLSWDAASWHMSKELLAFVETHNAKGDGSPRIELVPLPASAQFLNVIESVFSGMARAIIHNSDYPSVKAASEAIDRYFEERNRHYVESPRRAGNKIWLKERTEASFDPANNCKDPAYR